LLLFKLGQRALASSFGGVLEAFLDLVHVVRALVAVLIFVVDGLLFCSRHKMVERSALNIKSRHLVFLLLVRILVEVFELSTFSDNVNIQVVSTLGNKLSNVSADLAIKITNLDALDVAQKGTLVKVVIFIESHLCWTRTTLILYEFTSFLLPVEVHEIFLSINGLVCTVAIVTLAHNHLVWIVFDQMVWTVGNLLILKSKIAILIVLGV
jgi:hypothetical protein